MSKRTAIVRRLNGGVAGSRPPEITDSQAVGKSVSDADTIGEIVLPRDHPKWLRDRFVVSSTTQALLSRMKPFGIRLLGFWDHRTHRLSIEGATVLVDDSGAYRSV
jgi:hypothetical protein